MLFLPLYARTDMSLLYIIHRPSVSSQPSMQGILAFLDTHVEESHLEQQLEMLFFATKVGVTPHPKLLQAGSIFLSHACAIQLGVDNDAQAAALAKMLRRPTKNLAGWMLVHVGEVLWVFSVTGEVMEASLADDITYAGTNYNAVSSVKTVVGLSKTLCMCWLSPTFLF